MSRNGLTSGALLAAGAVLVLFTGSASAGPRFDHIDKLASQLERQARDLHKEVDAHFRRTPQYRHLHEDVTEMARLAQHIHEVAHDEGDVRHLRADVKKLDRLFHHVEEVVDDLAHSRGADRRAVRHIRGALKEMGRTLHHLREDLD